MTFLFESTDILLSSLLYIDITVPPATLKTLYTALVPIQDTLAEHEHVYVLPLGSSWQFMLINAYTLFILSIDI